jgi:hypothetical protein
MADEDHVALLKQGVEVWNAWRKENPGIEPDLSSADFSNMYLNDANLKGANFSRADLSRTILNGTNLISADLSEADLSRSHLFCTNLSSANLYRANFFRADLSFANLTKTNLCYADFGTATLIESQFDGADLTGAKLWETQVTGWSIKGIICQRAFWDRGGKEATEYESGAFERIFAEKPRIVLRYAGGMSPVDIAMLPLIVERLETDHPNSSLHIRSVQDDGSGAMVTITVEDLADRSEEVFKRDIEVIRRDLTDYQERWRLSEKNLLRIEAKYEELKENFNKVIDMPKYVVGQAGSVGDNAHAHDMTFQQAWNQSNIDLPRLAEELTRLRAAMKQETEGTREQDKAIVAVADAEEAAINGDGPTTLQRLKAAGKWALGIAEKIGVTVAAEAIKRTM